MTQIEQIIELGKLGYSKDDITALLGQQQAAPAAPAPTQQPAPTQPAPAQQPTNNVDFLEALKLIGQSMAQPATTTAAPAAISPAAASTPAAPETVQQPAQQPSISLSAEDLVKLTQGIAVQTAKGSIETPKSANDIILGMLDAYERTVKKGGLENG